MTDENVRDRIKPGDRVRLRCGAVLDAAREDRDVTIGGVPSTSWYSAGHLSIHGTTALDIVAILPRPMTADERLAKIANLVASRGERTDVLSAIMALAAPPAPLDPGRDVTPVEWSNAIANGGARIWETATRIVRNRLAEAEAARHE